jgi:uncharacterized protein involved in exopolysaccharide biosynthesis
LDEARQGAVVQVVDPAVRPDRKLSPKRTLIVAMAMLFALFCAILWVLVSEALARVQNDPTRRQQLAELKQIFGVRALIK